MRSMVGGEVTRWPVPGRIRLDRVTGDLVVDREDWGDALSPPVNDPRELLFGFLGLVAEEDEKVFDFASTWGVLELCRRHGLPIVHEVPRLPSARRRPAEGANKPAFVRGSGPDVHVKMDYDEPCGWDEWGDDAYRESVSTWRRLARQGQAMLTLAQKLRAHSPGSPEDWVPLDDPPVFPGNRAVDLLSSRVERVRGQAGHFVDSGAKPRREQVDEQRVLLASAIDAWLAWGAVRVINQWGGVPGGVGGWDSQQVQLVGQGLFGVLALQLNLEMAGRHAWATCVNCGVQYLPRRNPREGEATYCTRTACKKARNRDGVRRHRDQRQTKQT